MMNEIFTIKINNAYYVSQGKNFFKRAQNKNDAKKINGRGSLLSLLHTIYHCGIEFDEIVINRSEVSDATN